MREILFRGKHTHTNEFKYGYFVYNKEKDEYKIDTGIGLAWFVKPETVGQYTGRKDKNGTKIFKGDILADLVEQVCGVVEWNEDETGFIISLNRDFYNGEIFADLEVIGNIYDNPELLIDDGQEEN